MTKKRKITSSLFGEPKPQFLRVVLAATLGIVVAVGFAGTAQAQITEVWPTGNLALDQSNVENAVNKSGTVILHATNTKGVPTAFNFSYVYVTKDVTIKGEKLHGSGLGNEWTPDHPSNVYFYTPDGEILSDRTVVYCTEKYGGKMAFRLADERKLVIEGLRFDSFIGWAVYINACSSGGVEIRDNVITHILRGYGHIGIEIWDIPEWPETINGDIIIENNAIKEAKTVSIRARRAADLYISNNALNNAKTCIDVQKTADLYISNNTINDAKDRGIWAGKTADLYISNNTINNAETCIDVRDVSNGTITNNTITGEMQRGIYLKNTSNSVISSNMISRVISPPWHKWYNGAIALDKGENNIVRNNEIMGEGRSAIHLFRTHNNSILDNDCSGYTSKSSYPGQSWNVCQFWDSRDSSGNTVSGNIWGPVAPESRLATVVISFRKNASPSDDNILDNDYWQYNNVPGWTEANPDGPGCVLLTEGTENNFVFESGHFPHGTDAKSQVMDLGTNNRVVGHDADHVISPGIGQRLKEIMAEIDALTEEEEALLEEEDTWLEEEP